NALYVAIPAAQARFALRVPFATNVPVAETTRNSGSIVMLELAGVPVVPGLVHPVELAPGGKGAVDGPPATNAPASPASAAGVWVVGAVAAVAGAVLWPVPVAVLSSVPVGARPENSLALIALAVAVGWVTVMVLPLTRELTLCAAQMMVRTLVPLVTSTSIVY